MKTDVITYNLTERGRKYRGQDRDYSTPEKLPALVAEINSGALQEKVKFRDMYGYYGHDIRRLFGLIPPECAFVDGKKFLIEPDLVTLRLKAYKDGTVEHQEEFTQSEGGEKAWGLYKQKLGGFSSAINERVSAFHGFDYVFEPNFTNNRGHSTFDGVSADKFDELFKDYESHIQATFDKVSGVLKRYYGEKRQDFGVTMDRIDYLERQLERQMDELSEYKKRSVLLHAESGNHSEIYDNAESFLCDPEVDSAIAANRKTEDDGDEFELIIPEPMSGLRSALLSHFSKGR